MKKMVLGAGCFWGVEELLRTIPGIMDTEVGYCGGSLEHPTYNHVRTGETGHAEAVQITYDPQKITYSDILTLFFKLHDPTTKNRQGNDIGTQYRSVIFYENQTERAQALQSINTAASLWSSPIETSVEPLKIFYPAEAEHQDYLRKNPGGYTCHYWRG